MALLNSYIGIPAGMTFWIEYCVYTRDIYYILLANVLSIEIENTNELVLPSIAGLTVLYVIVIFDPAKNPPKPVPGTAVMMIPLDATALLVDVKHSSTSESVTQIKPNVIG